ncbi:MAG: hypothetical protein LBH03_05080 [Holophagales bacterium]|nr:hypothetical protein [Holophagales bacterium]
MNTRAILFLFAATGLMAQIWPKTVVESTNYERTSTVAEIRSHMDALIKFAPALTEYHPQNAPKTTETGKPILAWRIPATGKNPVKVYINANIHAGEVEGKEAVQLIVREILQGKHPAIRQNIDLVFCPAYNADGTDALDPRHRAHQPNPKSGVGPRENMFGLDLNRDIMKAAAANTRWMLAMYRDFDPDCTIDLHSTNGSRHGFYLTHAPSQGTGGDTELALFNRRMLLEIRKKLETKGFPTYDYGNFRMDSNRQPVKWETDSLGQNIVSNYPLLENRLGVLVETFVYRSYEDRVQDNVKFILETLGWIAGNVGEIQRERRQAQERWLEACSKDAVRLPLNAKLVETETRTFESFEFAMDEQGKPLRDEKGRYTGKKTTRQLTLPSFVTFEWTDYVAAPVGYLVDRVYADRIRPVLEAHGVKVISGTQRPKSEALLYFHETDRKISAGAFQGVFTLSLSGAWKPELHPKRVAYSWMPEDLDNALYIPINQPMGRLAFYLLDPRAPDGLVFWGFFSSSFVRGPGMWGEDPKCPILAVGINASLPPNEINTKVTDNGEE